jgi:hypothetical protein
METILKEALNQIKEKDYFRLYKKNNKKIILMGIGFLDKETGFKIEEI